jgi:hypothetical protein
MDMSFIILITTGFVTYVAVAGLFQTITVFVTRRISRDMPTQK